MTLNEIKKFFTRNFCDPKKGKDLMKVSRKLVALIANGLLIIGFNSCSSDDQQMQEQLEMSEQQEEMQQEEMQQQEELEEDEENVSYEENEISNQMEDEEYTYEEENSSEEEQMLEEMAEAGLENVNMADDSMDEEMAALAEENVSEPMDSDMESGMLEEVGFEDPANSADLVAAPSESISEINTEAMSASGGSEGNSYVTPNSSSVVKYAIRSGQIYDSPSGNAVRTFEAGEHFLVEESNSWAKVYDNGYVQSENLSQKPVPFKRKPANWK